MSALASGHHAHPPRLALRDGGFGLLNPCRLRRRRRKCGTHRRRPGVRLHRHQFQLRPRRPSTQRRPCPSISRRAERSTYWAGTPGPAHPRHQRSNSAGTPRSANTRCSHRGTPIGAASRPVQDLRFGGTPHDYDVFGSGGTKLPFSMIAVRTAPSTAGGWIRRQCPHLRKLFRACLLRLRNSDGAGRRSRQRNDDLQLRRGRDRRGRADLRSCCRNRVRLGGAVLGGMSDTSWFRRASPRAPRPLPPRSGPMGSWKAASSAHGRSTSRSGQRAAAKASQP